MSYRQLFEEQNIAEVRKVLTTRELIYFAKKALVDDPDDELVKSVKAELEEELAKESRK